ncbi:protein kinase [Nanoarchaeota archaeon]
MKKDYYNLLEVSPRARPEIISSAYDILLKEYSKDKKIVKNLKEAQGILLNKSKRKSYDDGLYNIEGKVIGKYKIERLIAEGGFGKTYYGMHTMINTPVCIKHANHISPQDEEILMEEAKAIWDLRHYGIPTIRDILKLDDGSMALVMSYIPGPTLEQIIEKNGSLDPENVMWITERCLNILKYLHFNGVVHGDIKPQNIIIQPDTHHVTLVDYGLSLVRPTAGSESKGYTPFFAPPEQIRGDTLLPESDFFGLGMTMIYALGGDIEKKNVPESLDDNICEFIKRFIVYDVMSRPEWSKEDLCESIQVVRNKVFGRTHSGMKKIPGF